MISMDQHLAFLVKQNLITAEQALPKAHDPSNLQKLLALGRQA